MQSLSTLVCYSALAYVHRMKPRSEALVAAQEKYRKTAPTAALRFRASIEEEAAYYDAAKAEAERTGEAIGAIIRRDAIAGREAAKRDLRPGDANG